jgi:hypothetical protein
VKEMGRHTKSYFLKSRSKEEAKDVIESIMEDIQKKFGPSVYVGPHAVTDKFPKKTDENYYISPTVVKDLMQEMFAEGRVDRIFSLKEHYRKGVSKVPLYRMGIETKEPEGSVSVKIGKNKYFGILSKSLF